MSEPRALGGRGDGRSAMGRAADARPFKPYVYRGGEPEAVTRARERHRALNAAIAETAGPGPDEAGYEWRREQLLEHGGEWPAVPADTLAPAAPEPCRRCAELEAAIDRLKAEIRDLTAAQAAAEEPAPPPVRCKDCGYLTGTTGHKVMCDALPSRRAAVPVARPAALRPRQRGPRRVIPASLRLPRRPRRVRLPPRRGGRR